MYGATAGETEAYRESQRRSWETLVQAGGGRESWKSDYGAATKGLKESWNNDSGPGCRGRESWGSSVGGGAQEWDFLDDGYFSEDERSRLGPLVVEEQAAMEARAKRCEEPKEWHKGKKVLGQGSCGVLSLAIDNASGQLLAVREVEVSTAPAALISRVTHEIQTLRRLEHTHVVAYRGSCVEQEKMCILLEYCAGGNIASIIARFGAVDETLCARYTAHALSGLAYLHRHCIVHRDIKCSNLLVTAEGVLKISDFGQVRLLKEACSVKSVLQYKGPEVLLPHGKNCRQSDIWALGCCIVEMLSGEFIEGYDPESSFRTTLVAGTANAAANVVTAATGEHEEDGERTPPLATLLPSGSIDIALLAPNADLSGCSPQALAFVDLCLQLRYSDRPSAVRLASHPFLASVEMATPALPDEAGSPSKEPGARARRRPEGAANGAKGSQLSSSSPLSSDSSSWARCRMILEKKSRLLLLGGFAHADLDTLFIAHWDSHVLPRARRAIGLTVPVLFVLDVAALYQNVESPTTLVVLRLLFLVALSVVTALPSSASPNQKTELIRRLVRLFYPYALTNPWGYGSVLNFGTKSILGFVVWQTLPLQELPLYALFFTATSLFGVACDHSYPGDTSTFQHVELVLARMGTCLIFLACVCYPVRYAMHRERDKFQRGAPKDDANALSGGAKGNRDSLSGERRSSGDSVSFGTGTPEISHSQDATWSLGSSGSMEGSF